jgi:O-antigen/teichoic acid export membrane protein
MADRNLANRVMYDGLFTFGMRMFNMLGAAAIGILTARLLGPSGKGLYVLPAVESGLVVTAFGGLNSAVSYYMLNRRPGRRILAPAFTTAALYVLAAAVALVPIALFSGHRWTLFAAVLFLPASAMANLAMGYAIGVKRVRFFTSIGVVTTLLTLVLMAAALLLIARDASVAVGVWLTANWIVAGCSVVAVFVHSRNLEGNDSIALPEFLKFGVKVGFVNLVSLLNYRADLYIVALLTSTAGLGLYTVAIAAAESLLVPTQVAALVTSPHIGSLDTDAAARLASRCVRNNLIVALLVCGVLFAVAPPVVRLLYGAAFLPVVPALRILLIGVFALSLGSPMSTYFTLKLGRPEVPLRLAAISAAICIGTALILVPRIGIAGAAIGSTGGYIVGQLCAFWLFSRTTHASVASMLVPTRADALVYRNFLVRLLADGRRLLTAGIR